MNSIRKPGGQGTPQKASLDSETYLTKGFLKNEHLLRIYQPKSPKMLSKLFDFLNRSGVTGVDLEMDNNETLCAALNALAKYGRSASIIGG